MSPSKVMVLFGTRPEIIKLAPVVWALERCRERLRPVVVSSSQHTDLLRPFVRELGVGIDHDLAVMTRDQSPAAVFARVLAGLQDLIVAERPDVLLVQGDTTTATAGALAAFYARVPVGHVEAGLRTDDRRSPFPEEVHRRLITQVADLHFAATIGNKDRLLAEGVDARSICVTGNTVVDALQRVLARDDESPRVRRLLTALRDHRIIALTTHRRENFGAVMGAQLRALRDFVARHPDLALVFPVHPNPAVQAAVAAELAGAARVHCIEPLEYAEFLHLLSRCWLIASDSGGVQEEAPSLGKPLLVLRDTTERPEVLECGTGRLVGRSAAHLDSMLEAAYADPAWTEHARTARNPFGDGTAGERIVAALLDRYARARDLA